MNTTIANQLRKIIDASGLSRYEIAKRSGLPQSTLSRFMSGKAISSDGIDAMADVLGLKLTTTKRKGK